MILRCAICSGKFCFEGSFKEDFLPNFCPMRIFKEVIEEVKTKHYNDTTIQKIYSVSAIVEKENYKNINGELVATKPRIRELIEFCKRMEFKTLGIAFCVGLSEEAFRIVKILNDQGFTVHSVCCKCGSLDKSSLGLPEDYKITPLTFEAACNPLLQAELLNKVGTQLNIIVGLCIGHDILFTMKSVAPVTTLIVKDRLTGHNPVASLYCDYHRKVINPKDKIINEV
ncbi:MAG: DUF1847 domain-containing protein [Saccharolobus sp.]|uniref:DUF1847 domain-containing protein n=1 Tax=Saccharolobus sp. TaxID=2100761 RepID=UPI00318285E4